MHVPPPDEHCQIHVLLYDRHAIIERCGSGVRVVTGEHAGHCIDGGEWEDMQRVGTIRIITPKEAAA